MDWWKLELIGFFVLCYLFKRYKSNNTYQSQNMHIWNVIYTYLMMEGSHYDFRLSVEWQDVAEPWLWWLWLRHCHNWTIPKDMVFYHSRRFYTGFHNACTNLHSHLHCTSSFSLSASLSASVNFDFVIAVALIKMRWHYDFDLEFSYDLWGQVLLFYSSVVICNVFSRQIFFLRF